MGSHYTPIGDALRSAPMRLLSGGISSIQTCSTASIALNESRKEFVITTMHLWHELASILCRQMERVNPAVKKNEAAIYDAD